MIYGCYAWMVLLIVIIPVAFGLALTPGVIRRRKIARWGARTVFALIGSPIRVLGRALLATDSCVVVANHASYLDGIILTAVLPAQFTFLIKQEMTAVPVAGYVLKRLGSEFVKREDAPQRHRTARRLVNAALSGKALALFPEGTFDTPPGLKDFHLGAFRAAWRGGLAVVPAVILGARSKLPGNALLPAPGPLTVHVCEPLPTTEYASAQALMRAARQAILERLDEPDLAACPPDSGTPDGYIPE